MMKELSWRVLVPALIISFGGGLHYGYQLSVLNPSEISFNKFINESYNAHYGSYLTSSQWIYIWPCVINMQGIGGLLGSFFITPLLEKLGRKRNFYLTNIILILTCIMQAISKMLNSWELLLVGRFISGFAQGIQLGLQPVYFNEISPKSVRGLVGSITGFSVEATFLLASILAMTNVLGSEENWPYLFVIEAIPSLLSLAILPFLPESPKYLASKGEYGRAGQALRWFGRTEENLKRELYEIRQELNKDRTESGSMSILTLLKTPYIRRGLFLGSTVIIAASYSGITALTYFSTRILEDSGVPLQYAQYGTVAITGCSCLGAIVGCLIIDRFGRRKIILTTNTVMLILNILFIIFAHLTRVYLIKWTGYANILVSTSITFMYGLGPALMVWLLTAELVPQKARSTANSLAMHMYWLFMGSAGLIFYPLQQSINEFCFLIHIVPLLISIVYFGFKLPETKNRSTLEIISDLGYTGHEHGFQTPLQDAECEVSI